MNQLEEKFRASRLWAEKQSEELKKDIYESRMRGFDTDHSGSQINTADQRNHVYDRQTTNANIRPEMSRASLEIKRPEVDTENIKKEVRVKLEPENISVLEPRGSESITTFQEKGPQASRHNSQQWLETTKQNLQEKCPQTSRKDVKERLGVSLTNIQEEGPGATKLNLGLETSIKSIQDFQEQGLETSRPAVSKDLEQERVKEIELLRDSLRKEWFGPSPGNLRRDVSEVSRQAVPKDLEHERPEVTEFPGDHLRKEWLGPSTGNLRRGGSKISTQPLPESLEQERPEVTELPRVQLRNEWLGPSTGNLRKEGSEVYRQAVQKNLEHKRPEVTELPRDHLMKGWLEASPENLRRSGSEASTIGMQPSLERTNLLQLSSDVDSCEVAPRSMLDGVSESGTNYEVEHLETPSQPTAEKLIRPIRDLQAERPGSSTLCVIGGLPAFIPKVRKGASRGRVQEWLEASMRSLEAAGPETSKLSLQQWLEESRRTLDETCPANSRHDVQEWLEASLENIRRSGSETSRQDVQEGLQAVIISKCSKKHPEASKQNLEEWHESRIRNLQVECPEESRKDMKDGLEISKSYLQEEGPETSNLNVIEWFKASMSTIQDLHERGFEGSKHNVHENLPEAPEEIRLEIPEAPQEIRLEVPQLPKYHLKKGWLEESPENLRRSGSEASTIGMRPSLETTNLLQLSSDEDSNLAYARSMLYGLSESGRNSEEEPLERTPSQPTAAGLVRSPRDFQAEGPGPSPLCGRGELTASIPRVRKGASRLRVLEWLESSMRSLEVAGPEASKLSLQQWLEESGRTLDEKCPANSRHDVHEWLQASLSKLPNTQPSTEEWIKASLMSLKEEGSEVPIRDLVEYLQGSIQDLREEVSRLSVQEWLQASLIKLQEEDPDSTRDDVKEWLESSLRKFRAVSPETSGHYVKKWLERSLRNLHAPKQNLQEYMREAIVRLRVSNLAASRTRHSMDWLQVPQRTRGARDSRGMLTREPPRALLDSREVSRTRLISKGNETDLDQEEAPEIPPLSITPEVPQKILRQREAPGNWLHDSGGSNTKMLMAKVSNTFRYRKPFERLLMIFLIPFLILLIAAAHRHFRLYCSSRGGLSPF